MNALLFDPEYISKYYNCSGRTYEEWQALGKPNVLLGFMYGFLGVIFMMILLPFMVVFMKSDLMKHSCYKIMFFLGIIDCIQIPVGGTYCGYAAAVGMVHCMAPTINYIFGGLALSCWGAGSTTCMLLAINRCIDVMNPQLGQKLFSGKKTLIWLAIPVVYFIGFFFFHTTVTFNSNLYAFFYDPFLGTPERNGTVDNEHYPHMVQSIHNIAVVIVLVFAYGGLLIHLSIQTAKSENSIKISKLQKQTFIQCTVVCAGTFIAALVYVYMQFLPTPVWVVICGEISWQFSHGAAGISYALFNTTMRKELVRIFCSNIKIGPNTGNFGNKKSPVVISEQFSHLEY